MIKRFQPEEVFFCTSDICTALRKENVIGSKVLDWPKFYAGLVQAIADHDPSKDRVTGQHFIILPKALHKTVSAGDGPKSDDPKDYVIRKHREGPKMFLKREKAGKVQFLAVVVYTIGAYLSDPDITKEERDKLAGTVITHVVVAVIASSGPEAPLTPFRFVHNLAGGNKEALVWTADEIREKAHAIRDYWTKWSVVAD